MHAFDRQTDRRTDGRTDRQTDRNLIARPRLHSMQRGKNQLQWRSPRDYKLPPSWKKVMKTLTSASSQAIYWEHTWCVNYVTSQHEHVSSERSLAQYDAYTTSVSADCLALSVRRKKLLLMMMMMMMINITSSSAIAERPRCRVG